MNEDWMAMKDNETDIAVNDPQPGDLYSELYSFWLYVIAVAADTVVTMEGSPPVTFPDEGRVRIQTKAEFKKRLSYESIPGYWVMIHSRGNNVEGWWRDTIPPKQP